MDTTLLQHELHALRTSTERLELGFARLPAWQPDLDWPAIERVLEETATRLQQSYPFHHPLYAGQMLKPPHAVARLAYALAMRVNPNNHALDGGPASSQLEKEAVAGLAAMLGFGTHLGHLCGG